MPISVFRKADRAGRGETFQSRGDINAIAHQVAVALLDHIAKMNADPELDAALRRKAGVAFDHAILHLDGTAHSVDHATKLHETSVAGALHHASVMYSDGRINQITPERPQTGQCPILVESGKPAVSDYISCHDRRELSGLGHDVPSATIQTSTKTRSEPGETAAATT